MLARKWLAPHFPAWNERWGAPNGESRTQRVLESLWRLIGLQRFTSLPFTAFLEKHVSYELAAQLRGYFAHQPNNSTRSFEYPWAFYASPLEPGMRVIDLGGSLAGFQFVLCKLGLVVYNVDPGEGAEGLGWSCTPARIKALNDAFKTDVTLVPTTLEKSNLPDRSFDRVFSLSAIEHFSEEEFTSLGRCVFEKLKPGGLFIVTADLFLDIYPFTSKRENKWGKNFPIAKLLEDYGFELVTGRPEELYGHSDFDKDSVQCQLEELVLGSTSLVQCLVLRRPI